MQHARTGRRKNTSGAFLETLEARRLLSVQISGTVFTDNNNDNVKQSGDAGIAGWTVWLDDLYNGHLDPGEPSTKTDSAGNFKITAAPGYHIFRVAVPSGWYHSDDGNSNDWVVGVISFTLADGQSTDLHVGMYQKVHISGSIFNDVNRDQIVDSGDMPLSGGKIGAVGTSSFITSDSNGKFTATAPPGTYTFDVIPLPGWQEDPPDQTRQITILSGKSGTIAPFTVDGVPRDVSGKVINDLNQNGKLDAGEPGLGGFTIYLDANRDGRFDAGDPTATSDSGGTYTFHQVVPGSYFFGEILKSGWALAPFTTNAFGYGFVPTGNPLNPIQPIPDVVATGQAALRVGVFNDLNGSGDFNSGEALANVKLFVDSNGNGALDPGEPTQTTDSSGYATFLSLPPGSCRIVEIPPAGLVDESGLNFIHTWTLLPQQSGTVSIGDISPSQRCSVGGSVFNDLNGDTFRHSGEGGLAGFTVKITSNSGLLPTGGLQTVSDANGNYTFSNIPQGTFALQVIPPSGSAWLQLLSSFNVVVRGVNQSTVNLAMTNGPYIWGYVFKDTGNGYLDSSDTKLSNVRVFLDLNKNGVLDAGEPSALTDVLGEYKFLNLEAGTYRLTQVVPSGMVPLYPTTTYSDVTVTTVQPYYTTIADAAPAAPVSLSGTVFNDLNSNQQRDAGEGGLAGWKFFIDLNQNHALDAGEPTAVSNASGVYTFSNVKTGRYLIIPITPAGWRLTHFVAWWGVSEGQNSTGLDFAASNLSQISGHVFIDSNQSGAFDTGDTALGNWTVYIDANNNGKLDAGERSTLTSSGGVYAFAGLAAGTYIVRVASQAGYSLVSPEAGSYKITVSAGQAFANNEFIEQVS